MYSFIVIISSTNKYRKQKQNAYLSVTCRQNDNYIHIYDGKMANCCQKVRGNKTNQRPKQQQKQTNEQKTTTTITNNKQNGRRGVGVKKQITNRKV